MQHASSFAGAGPNLHIESSLEYTRWRRLSRLSSRFALVCLVYSSCSWFLFDTSQLKVLEAAVKQSVEIANSTTFLQRLRSIFFVPVHRRALGEYLRPVWRSGLRSSSSHRLRPSGIPTTMWIQHGKQQHAGYFTLGAYRTRMAAHVL